MRKLPDNEKKKAHSLSIPQDLLDRAKERAKATNRNFSNYVQSLLEEDLQRKGGRYQGGQRNAPRLVDEPARPPQKKASD